MENLGISWITQGYQEVRKWLPYGGNAILPKRIAILRIWTFIYKENGFKIARQISWPFLLNPRPVLEWRSDTRTFSFPFLKEAYWVPSFIVTPWINVKRVVLCRDWQPLKSLAPTYWIGPYLFFLPIQQLCGQFLKIIHPALFLAPHYHPFSNKNW